MASYEALSSIGIDPIVESSSYTVFIEYEWADSGDGIAAFKESWPTGITEARATAVSLAVVGGDLYIGGAGIRIIEINNSGISIITNWIGLKWWSNSLQAIANHG